MDSNSFNSQNELDPEAQHLAFLQSQLIQPSPMQPVHHDPSSTPSSQFASAMSPAPKSVTAQSSSADSKDKSKSNDSPAPGTPLMFSVGPGGPMTPRTPFTPMTSETPIMPQLQNIVSTVNLGCKLDLKRIALHARNAEYNPKRFAAVIMRIREPRTTALIFSSGKMVCTGAKSEEMSRLAARKYARIVQKLGFEVCFWCVNTSEETYFSIFCRQNFLILKFKIWWAVVMSAFTFVWKVLSSLTVSLPAMNQNCSLG